MPFAFPLPPISRDSARLRGLISSERHQLQHRQTVVLAILVAYLTGCSYALPMGGADVGRGRPLGSQVLQLGLSGGRLPDLSATIRDVGVNPIPEGRARTTSNGGFDPIGVAVGISPSVDLGLNFSRGLYSVVRIAHGQRWSASVSPALYRYSSGQEDSGGHVTNINVSGLVSLDPWPDRSGVRDLYVGVGMNRYSARIDVGSTSASNSAVAPTILGGLRAGLPRCLFRCRDRDTGFLALGAEARGSWVRQRNDRRDFVPTFRIYFSLGGPLRLSRGRP